MVLVDEEGSGLRIASSDSFGFRTVRGEDAGDEEGVVGGGIGADDKESKSSISCRDGF